MSLQKYRFSISTSVVLDSETNVMLEKLCEKLDLNKSQVMRKAIRIMYLLFTNRTNSKKLRATIKRILKHFI